MEMHDRIEALTKGTEAGALKWESTSEKRSLALAVPGATVVLTNYKVSTPPSMITWDQVVAGTPSEGIRVSIRNSDGKSIHGVFLEPGDDDYPLGLDLWASAYDSVYQVKSTLSALDSALEAASAPRPSDPESPAT